MILNDWINYQKQIRKSDYDKIVNQNKDGLNKIYDPKSIQSLQLSDKKNNKIKKKK